MLWWAWVRVILAVIFIVYVVVRHRVVLRRRTSYRQVAQGRRLRARG